MQTADVVFNWWFEWGMLAMLLLDLGLIAWVVFDSRSRHVGALGWILATALPPLLVLPSVFYRFSDPATQAQLGDLKEPFFYFGLMGGLIPLVCAVGYLVSYRGYVAKVETAVKVAPPPPAKRPHANGWLIDAQNREYRLFQGDTRVGRGEKANDIAFAQTSVSREHLLIREKDGHFTLYDRGSKYGTFVNDARVQEPTLLQHGDEIRLGEVVLHFMTKP